MWPACCSARPKPSARCFFGSTYREVVGLVLFLLVLLLRPQGLFGRGVAMSCPVPTACGASLARGRRCCSRRLPLVIARADILNLLFLVFLYVTLGQSWNILGGFAGQVNLGHAAFFGIGALVTRGLWLQGWPFG